MGKRKYVLALVTDIAKLSNRSDEINVAENNRLVRDIVKDIKDTMIANPDLLALSAPQLGYPYRIFCIRFADENIQAFINPLIVKIEGKSLSIEHTRSLPDKEFMIERAKRVMVGYQLPSGQYNEISLNHPLSSLFGQMIDMIDGTLFFKYETMGLPIDQDYYKASDEEKKELHEWYFSTFLPARMDALKAEAENDKDIKGLQEKMRYFKSIIEGETVIAPVYENGEIDFENTSLKVKEAEDKFRKEYIDGLKKSLGVE